MTDNYLIRVICNSIYELMIMYIICIQILAEYVSEYKI